MNDYGFALDDDCGYQVSSFHEMQLIQWKYFKYPPLQYNMLSV